MTNELGETFWVVTLWSDLALDWTTAHVWSIDGYLAIAEALDCYPESRVTGLREGIEADLD